MQIGATWCRLVQRGADWCKEGIWKILLRNDRAQKSHVRRSRRQVERLNSQGCFKPVVLFPFFFSRVGGWDTEPQSTQSHHSFISSYASATPKGERVPKRTFHQRTLARLLGDPLGVYSFCYNFSETFFRKFSILACGQGTMKYVRCPNSSIQGKNGEEIRLLESGIFPYISSCKSDGFWTPGDKCCPFALQLAFGVRGALEISEPGGGWNPDVSYPKLR